MNDGPTRHFVALSDSASFFAPSWKRAYLLEYILKIPTCSKPTVRYVGAAKGDQPHRINAFYDLASHGSFQPEVLSFFELHDGNPQSFFSDTDIVYIDGGATRNLLAILREWDAIDALKDAYENGVTIVGASAGASMMFEWCLTDSIRSSIMPWEGIGVVPGTICVHHNAREARREALSSFMASEKARFPVYAVDDGVALHFENEQLARGVSVAPDAGCAVTDVRGKDALQVDLRLLADT